VLPTPWKIAEYKTSTGRSLIREFVGKLSIEERVEAAALIKALQEWGNALRAPQSKPLGRGLFELRGRQIRMFYTFLPDRRIVILDGVVKKRSRIPGVIIQRIRKLQSEVL
jgi:phage-related protein